MPIQIGDSGVFNAGISAGYGRVVQNERDRAFALKQAALQAEMREQAFRQQLAAAQVRQQAYQFDAARQVSPRDEFMAAQQEQETRLRYELQADLLQQELSQKEQVRLSQLKQQMGYVDEQVAGGTLTREEGMEYKLQLKTQIDPLQKRLAQTRVQQEQMQTKMIEQQANQQAEMFQRVQQFYAGKLYSQKSDGSWMDRQGRPVFTKDGKNFFDANDRPLPPQGQSLQDRIQEVDLGDGRVMKGVAMPDGRVQWFDPPQPRPAMNFDKLFEEVSKQVKEQEMDIPEISKTDEKGKKVVDPALREELIQRRFKQRVALIEKMLRPRGGPAGREGDQGRPVPGMRPFPQHRIDITAPDERDRFLEPPQRAAVGGFREAYQRVQSLNLPPEQRQTFVDALYRLRDRLMKYGSLDAVPDSEEDEMVRDLKKLEELRGKKAREAARQQDNKTPLEKAREDYMNWLPGM